ncbi:MAG: ATP-binding protein [Candidatus Eremiobacteraeota bacterium]|nr:ATP-binding protein [Candidatus Eremiobacteraeota bacterium]
MALDSDQCVRVFANLLENAVKYGRERGTVRVTYEHVTRASIDVCVDDDRPGIHPREREDVFALRFRGSAAPRATGSGLGPAIVRRTLEHVGGSIALLDSPLGGARFVASIPLRAEKTEALS